MPLWWAAATAASARWPACLPTPACRSASCRSARSTTSPRISASRWRSTSGGGHRRRPHPRRRPRRGQRRDLHQQFLDRHLPLHRDRPRAATGATQARQMDGHGAGLLPHAAALSAAAALRISAEGFAAAVPHALPVRRQQRIRHRAVHLRARASASIAGELWFYVVKPRTPLGFFWMVCRLCFGHMDQARATSTRSSWPRPRSAPRRAGCR